MIRELDTVTLRDGAPMTIRLIEPPAGEYAERLTRFLEHKGNGTARDIAQRLRGDYVADCLDRFFVGEIEDRIAAQMWYTLPREQPDFGVFGHVYTEPEQRGRGAASTLMGPLLADFLAGPGQGLFCGVGDPSAQRIYARHGFVPLLAGGLRRREAGCDRDGGWRTSIPSRGTARSAARRSICWSIGWHERSCLYRAKYGTSSGRPPCATDSAARIVGAAEFAPSKASTSVGVSSRMLRRKCSISGS